MSKKLPFSKIFEVLERNLHSQTIDAPVDFTIRPNKIGNETVSYQLTFTSYVGGKLQLATCSILLNQANNDNYNCASNWKFLLNEKELSSAPSTLAENLMNERMRILKQGITFYDLHFESNNLLLMNDGLMYSCFLEKNDEISSLKMLDMNNAMNVKRNPLDWKILAYLKDRNVFIFDIMNNISTQLTFNGPDIGSGCTHYIIQEEFDRLEAMWWRPHEDNKNEYHLLIEEYDESHVEKLIIPCYSFGFENEEYRYPQTGKRNARSMLKILKIKADTENKTNFQCEILEFPNEHWKYFYNFEYLTNAGWTPDGKFVWVQLVDRLQNCLSTYLLSIDSFISMSDSKKNKPKGYAMLLNKEINEKFWVPVNMNTQFLKSCQTESKHYTCSFIIGQSINGFNHLYLKKIYWKIPPNNDLFVVHEPDNSNTFALTNGNWEVDCHNLWINEKEEIVYFLANRDDILANHLYGLSYGEKEKDFSICQITSEDSIAYINPEEDWAVVHTCSLGSALKIKFINLKNLNSVTEYTIFEISHPFSILFDGHVTVKQPKLLKYNIIDSSGTEIPLYGLLFVPDVLKSKPWPTLHYVYGGPSVRLVENSYNKNFLYFAQKINHFGYALLVCDGRGSSRRGLEFHGHIKNKMGTVELDDQIYFLQKAALDTGLIDIDRVAIYGSSYGGYLTIMAMFKHSNIYKCGFSCSPVVDFRFYDTAYTERYMGIPDENMDSYLKASVLTYISDLPKDRCRLIVAHGGKDENVHFLHTSNLLRFSNIMGHDIKFLFYPNSRHGIKDRAHLESHLIKFLNKNLSTMILE